MADTSFRNVIGGELVDSASGETYDIIDPTTGEVYATAPMSGAEDIDRAYRAAEKAFEGGWGDTTPSERQRALLKIADALEKRAQEFVDVESRDTGQAARLHDRRGAAAGDRPAPVLRRRGPGARGQVRRASTSRTTPRSYDASRSASSAR